MIKKPKYMRRVFSGKDEPIIGVDQGKGPLYRGDGALDMHNAYFESCLEQREGHVLNTTYDGGINTAGRLRETAFLGEGNSLWAEAV